MAQTRLGSFIESVVNIGIGFFVALAGQLVIFPMYGIETNFHTNFQIALWFTVLSIARSYVIRRWFNFYTVRKMKRPV